MVFALLPSLVYMYPAPEVFILLSSTHLDPETTSTTTYYSHYLATIIHAASVYCRKEYVTLVEN